MVRQCRICKKLDYKHPHQLYPSTGSTKIVKMQKRNQQEREKYAGRSFPSPQNPRRERAYTSLERSVFEMQLNQGMDLSVKQSPSAANNPETYRQENNVGPARRKIFSGLPTLGRSGFQGYSGSSSVPCAISPPSITTRPSRSTECLPFNNFSSAAMWQYMNLPHTVTSKATALPSQRQDVYNLNNQVQPTLFNARPTEMPPPRQVRSARPSTSQTNFSAESMDWQTTEPLPKTASSSKAHVSKKHKKKVSWCDQPHFSGAAKGGSEKMPVPREKEDASLKMKKVDKKFLDQAASASAPAHSKKYPL